MLVKKEYNKDEIITVQLMTGQEVLGRFVSKTDVDITISCPLVPVQSADKDGNPTMGFQQPMITAALKGEVTFERDKVTATAPSNKEFAELYVQALLPVPQQPKLSI